MVICGLLLAMYFASTFANADVVNTQGSIGNQQRDLLYFATGVMMLIIIPIFVLLLTISWRYRASNTRAVYKPNWSENPWLETAWWGLPIAIVLVLSVVTWDTSHRLDPQQPIVSDRETIQVQVVALQWRWLFIYPKQGVASINQLVIPVDQPVKFSITSDAPMNSFWIPQLGGQIYAMAGMSTSLNLIADNPGNYRGVSANISGSGHADMNFMTQAVTEAEFADWVIDAATKPVVLDKISYSTLRTQSRDSSVQTFALADPGLYGSIVGRYGHGDGGEYAR